MKKIGIGGRSWLEDLERKKSKILFFLIITYYLRFVLFKIKWLGHGLQRMEELGAVNRLLRIIILVFLLIGGVGEKARRKIVSRAKRKKYLKILDKMISFEFNKINFVLTFR